MDNWGKDEMSTAPVLASPVGRALANRKRKPSLETVVAQKLSEERTFGSLREGQRVGAGRGRGHTPRIPSTVQQRAPTHAPLRAGQAPSRRRAAAGGGSGPRFLSPGLRASSHRSPGELRLAAAAEPASSLVLPRHAEPCPGDPTGAGAGAGAERGQPRPHRRRGRPRASRPSRPASLRPPSLRGVGRRHPPRAAIERPGRPPAAGATSPNRTSVAAFGSGTLPGPRRLHCFLPPDSLPPLPPPFFPPQPGLRGRPPACLAVLPPSLFASIHLFVPHPLGTPAPLPSSLAAWTVLQAADAARGEVAWTAVPRER
ncbi:doublesex- and mab-3-related transcription factor B1-like [Meriones unguiculatus]|uniref:doublesex- and mab-3-related transcription factor B1-like n=1 Tax=Meriones unguiculatus TaxID=10047 RepID=UPI00293F012F|nr:doublesex- and mab-3-related transcription factor B1-like [Meriones unguiculatus]